jgi:hypothetical protein
MGPQEDARTMWPVKCVLDDPVNELYRELRLQVLFHCDDVPNRCVSMLLTGLPEFP